jgi:hypothetical protein
MRAYYGYFAKLDLDKAIACVEKSVECAILADNYIDAIANYESMMGELKSVRPRYNETIIVQYILLKLNRILNPVDYSYIESKMEYFGLPEESPVNVFLRKVMEGVKSGQSGGEKVNLWSFYHSGVPNNLCIAQLMTSLVRSLTTTR